MLKRIISFALICVLLFAMSASAFAATRCYDCNSSNVREYKGYSAWRTISTYRCEKYPSPYNYDKWQERLVTRLYDCRNCGTSWEGSEYSEMRVICDHIL